MATTYEFDPQAAVAHLRHVDRGMDRLIQQVGTLELPVKRSRSVFEYLIRSIVYQQLSGKAAATIHTRLLALFPNRRIDPERLLKMSDHRLRSAGLSRSKCLALRDLAARAHLRELPTTRQLQRLADQEIINQLTQIRGIGPWTVQMLLIFYLGRPDVLPVGDLGVRKGYQQLRGFKILPDPDKLERAGRRWRPYRSVATWYLWRALDLVLPTD